MRFRPLLVLAYVAALAGSVASALGASALGGRNAPRQPAASSTPIRAAVSIVPLQGLLEPLIAAANGGDNSANPKRLPAVVSVIPPGQSEHGYEIPPSRLAALRDVDIVVVVGFGLDTTIEKFLASNPPPAGKTRRIVRFADAAGLTDEEKESLAHHAHDHVHGEHCDHSHEVDPHIWLDPLLVERLVRKLTAEVVEAVKADAEAMARVEKAGEELRQRVLAVHESYALTCAAFTTRTIVVGHDAWRRLAGRYGLETVAIADLNASEPTAKALERAVATIKQKRLGVVFVEPQLGERAGRRIAEAAGAKLRRLDPLGEGDWFGMMESNLAELKAALAPTPESQAKP